MNLSVGTVTPKHSIELIDPGDSIRGKQAHNGVPNDPVEKVEKEQASLITLQVSKSKQRRFWAH